MRFFKIEKIFEELHTVVTPCNSCKLCNCCPFGNLFSSKKKGNNTAFFFGVTKSYTSYKLDVTL